MYYLKRCIALGPSGIFRQLKSRITKKIFALRWRFNLLPQTHFTNPTDHIGHILQNPLFIKYCLTETGLKEASFSCPTNHFPHIFYQHIAPRLASQQPLLSLLYPDIKTPWEYSRFNHLSEMCLAGKAEPYEIETWVDQNPFLIGVNWVCPMEVAIRAINWIFCFHFFKDAKKPFWDKFLTSLYNHLIYLENNWEVSDKPNNHYLADLVGYFYLCTFFNLEKKQTKTFYKILEQFDHQINPDGTSYEGSTAYHKLDTELLWLFCLLCQAINKPCPNKKLTAMITFLSHIESHIGDDDSGKILTGINIKTCSPTIKHYADFGITIRTNKNFSLTFRHPTYKKNQPTGHFHNDQLAITLTYANIPILVDPGSYLYTANASWRNLMRSFQSHNTFFTSEEAIIDPNLDLFQLPRIPQEDTAEISPLGVKNFYNKRARKVTLEEDKVKITDTVSTNNLTWNFIFHPHIKLKKNNNSWEIYYQQQKLLILTSDLELEIHKWFYAPKYGIRESCIKLTNSHNPQQNVVTILHAAQTK